MASVLKASVALTILVALLTVVLALTGLNRNPVIGGLGGILVAILFNVAVVFWALKRTAGENPYGKQLFNSVLIGIIAGALIFLVSWVMLTAMPGYYEGIKEGNIEWLRASGMPDEQVQVQIEKIRAGTAVGQSFAGLVGTLVTSTLAGAVVAAFQRRKATPAGDEPPVPGSS